MKRPPPALVSPQAKKQKRTVNSGRIQVQDVLEVFTQLEQLQDHELRSAIVHGRQRLQALADDGTIDTQMSTVITIIDDSTATLATGEESLHGKMSHNEPPDELHIPTEVPRLQLKPSQYPPDSALTKINDNCFDQFVDFP